MESNLAAENEVLKAKIKALERNLAETEAWEELYHKFFQKGNAQLTQLSARIGELEARNRKLENPTGIHYNSLCWRGKIIFVIKKWKRPLRAQEIVLELQVMEKEEWVIGSLCENHFSVVLSKAVKSGQLHIEKLKGVQGAFYALPSWLDEEGKLSEKMMRHLW